MASKDGGTVDKKFAELILRLDEQLGHAVLEHLPALTVQIDQLWAKYSATTLNQNGLPDVDEQLIALHAQCQPICQDAVEQTHLIESRIRRLTSDVRLTSEVLVGEVLDRSLKLAEALRRDLEDLLVQLNNFHQHRCYHIRKLIKHPGQGPEALAEFDRKSVSMTRIQLAKARNAMVALYKILSENLDHFMRERPRTAGGPRTSSLYH